MVTASVRNLGIFPDPKERYHLAHRTNISMIGCPNAAIALPVRPTSPRALAMQQCRGLNPCPGMALFQIPKYAGMTAGEHAPAIWGVIAALRMTNWCDGEGSRVCFWEDPVLASPPPSPRCNLHIARFPGLRTMRSACQPRAALHPQQGPRGPHGHSSTTKEQDAGNVGAVDQHHKTDQQDHASADHRAGP